MIEVAIVIGIIIIVVLVLLIFDKIQIPFDRIVHRKRIRRKTAGDYLQRVKPPEYRIEFNELKKSVQELKQLLEERKAMFKPVGEINA